MKTFSLILFCIAYSAQIKTSAQNIDRENVAIKFVRLPLKKFPDSTETYFIKIKPSGTSYSNNFGGDFEESKVVFNGYYKLDNESDADVKLFCDLSDQLQFRSTKSYTLNHTYKKDKNSPEIKYTAYYYTVNFITPRTHYVLETGNNNKIDEDYVGGREDHFSFGSGDYDHYYSNEYQLERAWNAAKKDLLAEEERKEYGSNAATVQSICALITCRNGKIILL